MTVEGFSGIVSMGKIRPSLRSGASEGYKPKGSRIGLLLLSIESATDDLTASFVRAPLPLRGEKAEAVAAREASAKSVNFMLLLLACVVVVDCVVVLLVEIMSTNCDAPQKSVDWRIEVPAHHAFVPDVVEFYVGALSKTRLFVNQDDNRMSHKHD